MAVRDRGTVGVPRWYFDFTIKSVRYKGAIPEARTRKEAEKVENQKRLEVYEGRYGKLSGTDSFPSFVQNVYLDWARQNKRSYYNDEILAKVVCEFFAGKTFRDISPLLVEKFKRHRREGITKRGKARNMGTVNRELAVLSKIFSLAVDNGYCESNPCRKVKAFKVDNRKDRFITHDEESRLLAALTGRDAHLRPIAIVALYTGMRRSEILRLEWRDVDLVGNEIRIPKGTTKSGKGRVIPIDETVREALLSLRGERMESDRVFEGKGFNPESISNDFSKVCRLLGWHDVTLHTLRHTYATRLKDAGTDPFTIRDLLGHATLRMTDIYTHATPETMRRAVKLLERQTPDVHII